MPTVGCMQPTAKSAAWRFVEKSPETAPDGGAQTFALFESAAEDEAAEEAEEREEAAEEAEEVDESEEEAPAYSSIDKVSEELLQMAAAAEARAAKARAAQPSASLKSSLDEEYEAMERTRATQPAQAAGGEVAGEAMSGGLSRILLLARGLSLDEKMKLRSEIDEMIECDELRGMIKS